MNDAKSLVDSREPVYGRSWTWMTKMLGGLPKEIRQKLQESFYFHPWYMILSKLARLAVDPTQLDGWRDIQGYAQLVIDVLEPISKKEGQDEGQK